MPRRHAHQFIELSYALAIIFLSISSNPAVAQDAEMQYPLAVAATEDGTIYIADLHLPGIWKLADGKPEIYFQASKRFRTPLNRVRCLAIDQEGRLLAGDSATREIYRFSEDAKPEPLTGGQIGTPVVLAVDKEGTIFTSDLETQRIWSIPKDGLKTEEQPAEVAVIAGVRGLAFNPDGELLAVTTHEDPIRKIDAEGNVEILVEGRPFEFPHQIAVAADRTMYVSDNYTATIWKIPAGGGEPTPLAQGDPLNKPVGLTLFKENLLVADPHARQIFSITPEGEVSSLLK